MVPSLAARDDAMEYIIAGCVLWGSLWIWGWVAAHRERKRAEKSARVLSPKVRELIAVAESVDVDSLGHDAASLNEAVDERLVALLDSRGSAVNLCPRCGDTLTLRSTVRYGEILGCPNYPRCRHLVRVSDLRAEDFLSLRVEGQSDGVEP